MGLSHQLNLTLQGLTHFAKGERSPFECCRGLDWFGWLGVTFFPRWMVFMYVLLALHWILTSCGAAYSAKLYWFQLNCVWKPVSHQTVISALTTGCTLLRVCTVHDKINSRSTNSFHSAHLISHFLDFLFSDNFFHQNENFRHNGQWWFSSASFTWKACCFACNFYCTALDAKRDRRIIKLLCISGQPVCKITLSLASMV